MLTEFLFLAAGFGLLIKGADLLVSGASSLAKRYHVSELLIGLTVVAFGTSAPELIVNIIASRNNYSDVVLGNVIGSNLFNVLLILGISGLIIPIKVQVNTIWKELPYSLFAAVIMLLLANNLFITTNRLPAINRIEAGILLLFFGLFLSYIFFNARKESAVNIGETKALGRLKTVLFIIFGLCGLVFGGKLVVDNAIKIAVSLSVSEKLIGLTIVSVGTSLPELATSVIAAMKKRSDLAIGNVIGSNIFNIFLILGVSGIVAPIEYNISFNIDIIFLIGATLFLFVAMFTGIRKQLDRWEAAILLLFFGIYLFYLINKG